MIISQNLVLYLLVHLYQSKKCIQTLKNALEADFENSVNKIFICKPTLPQEQTYHLNIASILSQGIEYFSLIEPLVF